MQHKIPKQAKLILVAVKLATFGEKGWGSDREGTPRSFLGRERLEVFFSSAGGCDLTVDGDLTGILTFGNSLCCIPMNCAFFCICALFFNLKRILQNK